MAAALGIHTKFVKLKFEIVSLNSDCYGLLRYIKQIRDVCDIALLILLQRS
jgi:hypothetical protein